MTIKNDLQTIKQYLFFSWTSNDIKQQYKEDKIKFNFCFSCLCDDLQKDNCISEKTRQNVYVYQNKKGAIILTCLSYKEKIA